MQLMPPAAYISQPATGCASKFVHLSWNKVRFLASLRIPGVLCCLGLCVWNSQQPTSAAMTMVFRGGASIKYMQKHWCTDSSLVGRCR